jgi:hypothetical protein
MTISEINSTNSPYTKHLSMLDIKYLIFLTSKNPNEKNSNNVNPCCMKERVPYRMENKFEFPDGPIGWFELSIQPVPDGIFLLSLDITERKRADAARDKQFQRINLLN